MNERSERSKRISEGMMRHWAQRKKVDQSHDRRLGEIRARLAGVDPTKPWKYNPEHEMFVGTTNALEMYHGTLDLGRNAKEWYEYKDETGSGWRLTESSKKQMARVKALGEFLESCREDIAYLLELVDAHGIEESQ